jgi:hypothetical protein
MKAAANHWSLKLSQEFATRLASIPADERLHAVVLLKTSEQRSASHRQTPRQRRAAIGALREACRPALIDLDQVLAKWGGRRLDDEVSALRTVAVEATPAAIRILANLKGVQTVLEDQSVSLLP